MPEFNEIFEREYNGFGSQPENINRKSNLSSRIRGIIDSEIEQLPTLAPVRPDAKLFLLVNSYHFVLQPLSEEHPNAPIEPSVIASDLRSDIRQVLVTSDVLAKLRGKEEISGHIVLDAASAVWQTSKTVLYSIWG